MAWSIVTIACESMAVLEIDGEAVEALMGERFGAPALAKEIRPHGKQPGTPASTPQCQAGSGEA